MPEAEAAATPIFAPLPPAQQDPLMQALESVRLDTSPDRVDLGVGVYMNDVGQSTVLASVKEAERWLLTQQASKAYLSSAGSPAFIAEVPPLLLGEGAGGLRTATIQTVGGSGALRVGAELIARSNPQATIWVPDPSWANHHPIMAAAGVKAASYPYYDRDAHTVAFDPMLAVLRSVKAGDAVILHGCCHNPSGADLKLEQWSAVAEVLERAGALAFVDIAYQGFAQGIDEDAAGLRLIAKRLPDILVATSFSKNFGLYRDRVGALMLVTRTSDTETVWRHMLQIVRTSYSMPPDHGASLVAHILGTPELRARWTGELSEMRDRVRSMRARFAELLGPNRYGYLSGQNGMFSFLDITPEQVAELRERHHIHAVSTGRINLAGLTSANIERVAAAILEVSGH